MDQDLCARWCQRCLVEIKGTVELCFGGEFGIDARGTEEIQSGGGLFDESTPQMEREIWIGAAQNGNEVIFPGGWRWHVLLHSDGGHEAGQAERSCRSFS